MLYLIFLKINGLVENGKNKEELLTLFLQFMKEYVKVEFQNSVIEEIFRLGSINSTKQLPLLVVFKAATATRPIFNNRLNLKGENVYLNEHLTPQGREKIESLLNIVLTNKEP